MPVVALPTWFAPWNSFRGRNGFLAMDTDSSLSTLRCRLRLRTEAGDFPGESVARPDLPPVFLSLAKCWLIPSQYLTG